MTEREEHDKVSKKSVSYRPAAGDHRCGNCSMYHHGIHKCGLVKGDIYTQYVCNKWEAQ
jgi:hypothetical protein